TLKRTQPVYLAVATVALCALLYQGETGGELVYDHAVGSSHLSTTRGNRLSIIEWSRSERDSGSGGHSVGSAAHGRVLFECPEVIGDASLLPWKEGIVLLDEHRDAFCLTLSYQRTDPTNVHRILAPVATARPADDDRINTRQVEFDGF